MLSYASVHFSQAKQGELATVALNRQSLQDAPMMEPCSVKRALLLSHSDAAKVYADLVSSLYDTAGKVSEVERKSLHAIVERWRARTELERMALEEHIKQHGC
jgi:hypothetical protein